VLRWFPIKEETMKITAVLLIAIGALAQLGCESKTDNTKPASTPAPASSAKPATTGGW
jgi:hypothetical protein